MRATNQGVIKHQEKFYIRNFLFIILLEMPDGLCDQQGDQKRSDNPRDGQGPGYARHKDAPEGQGPGGARHQEDAGGHGREGPWRTLRHVRGPDNWPTVSTVEVIERPSIAAELNMVKLPTYCKDRSNKAELDHSKVAPKFEMDNTVPWSNFVDAFKATLQGSMPRLLQVHLKRLLYIHLKLKAQRLGGTDNIPQEHERKMFVEYYTMLGNIIELLAQSKQIKLGIEARIQLQREHPHTYYTDNSNLCERAYPAAQRDSEMFYRAVNPGLIDLLMKEGWRDWVYQKCTAKTEFAFAEQLVHTSNVHRKRYITQERSENVCYRAEAMLQSGSYRNVGEGQETTFGKFGSGSKQVNNEPLYALQKAARANQKRGYVDRECSYCAKIEPYLAQCPREDNGIPAVGNVEPDDHDGQSVHAEQAKPAVNASGSYSNHQNNPQETTHGCSGGYSQVNSRNLQGKPRHLQNHRVAYINEDENGDTVIEDELETNSRVGLTHPAACAPEEDEKGDTVIEDELETNSQGGLAHPVAGALKEGDEGHSVHALLEGVDGRDFIPTPFLGGN